MKRRTLIAAMAAAVVPAARADRPCIVYLPPGTYRVRRPLRSSGVRYVSEVAASGPCRLVPFTFADDVTVVRVVTRADLERYFVEARPCSGR